MDADHPTPHAVGAGIPEWADIARGTEPGPPTAAAGRCDRHLNPSRTGHGAGLEVDAELVFGEPAAGCGGELGFDHWGEPVGAQPGQVGAVP
jgi:hypothetical protein